MNRTFLKFLCCLAFSLQVLSVSGIARVITVCTHPDGQSRIETATELAACHAKQQANDVAIVDRTCVDSPFAVMQSTQQVTNGRVTAFEASQIQVVLPAFLRQLIPDVSLKPCVTRLAELSRTVPDGERASLKTVVLVI